MNDLEYLKKYYKGNIEEAIKRLEPLINDLEGLKQLLIEDGEVILRN